jgi:hypothetical protein
MRITDMQKLTTLDRLADRGKLSLSKFMLDAVEGRKRSAFRNCCIDNYPYSMSSKGYIIPRFNTEVGRQRLLVRGLKLLNSLDDVD